jgi:hypothetical protein
MGYWENTTYVNHGSAPEVAEALTALFAREGMEQFDPPNRVRRGIEPMQYEGALQNDVWGVAAFPGAPGWTVVKTAPLELLAERREGADRMRLAARLAGANAESCDNLVSVLTLVQHDPLDAPGGIARYFRWTGPSRQRAVPTDSWEEYRARRGDRPQ